MMVILQTSARRSIALRYFCSSPLTREHARLSLKSTQARLSVTGPLGTTSVPLESYMTLDFPAPGTLTLGVENAQVKKQCSMWGLTQMLIQNAVSGMTEGFSEERTSEMRPNMKLGFSHPVIVPVPDHIKAEVPHPTKIWRPPEPYKGKVGVFISDETIRIKAVKKKWNLLIFA
ncbi:hypothetical protein F5148DRAFT_1163194, partial [Russula earlei]